MAEPLVTNTWLMVLCLSILCFKSLENLMVKFCISTRCYSILKLWSDLCQLDNSWSLFSYIWSLHAGVSFNFCMHSMLWFCFQRTVFTIVGMFICCCNVFSQTSLQRACSHHTCEYSARCQRPSSTYVCKVLQKNAILPSQNVFYIRIQGF